MPLSPTNLRVRCNYVGFPPIVNTFRIQPQKTVAAGPTGFSVDCLGIGVAITTQLLTLSKNQVSA